MNLRSSQRGVGMVEVLAAFGCPCYWGIGLCHVAGPCFRGYSRKYATNSSD